MHDLYKVRIKLTHPQAKMPEKKHRTDSGYDLVAVEEVHFTQFGQRELIDCGFSMELPVGYEAQIRPRSGLATKHGLTVINSPGTIDQAYRGPIKVGLIYFGNDEFTVKPGDRIAQMVFQLVPGVQMICVSEMSDDTERGTGGFGSTGL